MFGFLIKYNIPMSFFSFLQKNKESYSLVFQLGSGSLSGGIIKFTEKPGETVLYYGKELIPFQAEISAEKHLNLMKTSLTNLAHKIQSDGLKNISLTSKKSIKFDRVFYTFSSPWSTSQTKIIRVKEPKPIKITQVYLNKLISEQEKQFLSGPLSTSQVIEKKIIQVKINGYVVNDFYGKSAKDLELVVFFTAVPVEILKLVESAVSKTFNVKNVWCHSLALSVFSIVRNLFPQKEDFICLDINEEMTDILTIKDDIITSNSSIPFGRNNYLRELSASANVSEEVADSMIKLHNSKSHDELAAIKLSVSMDKVATVWSTKVFEVLDCLKEKVCISDSIFLISDSHLVSFLQGKLQRHGFKIFTLDNKKVKPPTITDDLSFKLVLMFLDNIYKI